MCNRVPHRILLSCTHLLHNICDIDNNVELFSVPGFGGRDRTFGRSDKQ